MNWKKSSQNYMIIIDVLKSTLIVHWIPSIRNQLIPWNRLRFKHRSKFRDIMFIWSVGSLPLIPFFRRPLSEPFKCIARGSRIHVYILTLLNLNNYMTLAERQRRQQQRRCSGGEVFKRGRRSNPPSRSLSGSGGVGPLSLISRRRGRRQLCWPCVREKGTGPTRKARLSTITAITQ